MLPVPSALKTLKINFLAQILTISDGTWTNYYLTKFGQYWSFHLGHVWLSSNILSSNIQLAVVAFLHMLSLSIIAFNLPPHLCSQVDAGRRVIAVQVEVHYHSRRKAGVQLGPAETQPTQEAQHHQYSTIDSQEGGGHHGVAAPVSHHPNYTGPHQQGESQPVVVGDTPHLQAHVCMMKLLQLLLLCCCTKKTNGELNLRFYL